MHAMLNTERRFIKVFNQTMLFLSNLDICELSYKTEIIVAGAQQNSLCIYSLNVQIEARAVLQAVNYFERFGLFLL